MTKKRQRTKKVIASCVDRKCYNIEKENLPLPWVHYSSYPSFIIGFSKKESSTIYLCKCFERAIKNYIQTELYKKKSLVISDLSYDLPNLFFKQHRKWFCNNVNEALIDFKFLDKLCHECNKALPSINWTSKLYGRSDFECSFGWYISKMRYELGINYNNWYVMREILSNKILKNSKKSMQSLNKSYKKILEENKRASNSTEYNLNAGVKWQTIINDCFDIDWDTPENETRVKFGFKEKGFSSVSETILFNLVKNIFSSLSVIRHFRGDWLKRLELDIFIPELKLGIEYQGEQHFVPINHWGGEKALKDGIERDKKKKELCEENGVNLVYFFYDELLTEDLVKKRLNKYIESNLN